MEYDPDRGDVVFYRKEGRIQVGWGVAAVLVFIAILLVGQWALNCVGSEGRLEYHGGWFSLGRTTILGFHFDLLRGNSIGLMWLQQGQRVEVSYQAQGEEDKWDDSRLLQEIFRPHGEYAGVWFGPLEDWAWKRYAGPFYRSGSLLEISNGGGSREFVASKTGFHILCYFARRHDADFSITWRAL